MSKVFGYMQKHGYVFTSLNKSYAVSKKWIFMDSWMNKGVQLHLIKCYIHPSNHIYPIIRVTYGYILILIEQNRFFEKQRWSQDIGYI